MSDSLRPHESQHSRPPCPSPSPGVHSNSHPLSRWCHPPISSSVIPFSSCPQSLPASESFPMSQLFAWCGQSTGVSALASFLPNNTQDWSPLEWTGWISLQSKGVVWLQVLYWICDLQIYFPRKWFVFSFFNSLFSGQKMNFNEAQIHLFSFMDHAFSVLSKILSPN